MNDLIPSARLLHDDNIDRRDQAIRFTILIPCYNEVGAIEDTVRQLDAILLAAFGPDDFEILVIDDGSSDGSDRVLAALTGEMSRLHVIRHARNRGYGASLKTGVRRARGNRIAITDADGTYPHARMPDLLAIDATMVVGARIGEGVDYSKLRAFPKIFLRRYAQWVTQEPIPDINSGMRVFDRALALRHIHILPDGFSFTTTITIASLMEDQEVAFVPISYTRRIGASKIAPIRDTLRFLMLILRTGMYFAPLRMVSPVLSLLALLLVGSVVFDVFVRHDVADLTISLLTITLNVGLLALIADMVRRRTER
jgi:glycosyltransferase involved in cell wall biosynthesis